MTKRLVIDLETCSGCPSCTARCAYFYRPHAQDHGIDGLRERATFALLCRRCPEPSCIKACAYRALERQPDGLLARHNLRCVSCKLCAQACPFGIIYPELLGFYETPCDFCTGSLGPDDRPPCVASCPRGAVAYREVEAAEVEDGKKRLHLIGEHLAAIADAWDPDPDAEEGRG